MLRPYIKSRGCDNATEAEGGDFEAAFAECALLHGCTLNSGAADVYPWW